MDHELPKDQQNLIFYGIVGFQEVGTTRFEDNRQIKMIRLSAPRIGNLYPPGYITGTHFSYRMSYPQGHSLAWSFMSKKNSSDNIGNRTRVLPACRAVPQPTAPSRAPDAHVHDCTASDINTLHSLFQIHHCYHFYRNRVVREINVFLLYKEPTRCNFGSIVYYL